MLLVGLRAIRVDVVGLRVIRVDVVGIVDIHIEEIEEEAHQAPPRQGQCHPRAKK